MEAPRIDKLTQLVSAISEIADGKRQTKAAMELRSELDAVTNYLAQPAQKEPLDVGDLVTFLEDKRRHSEGLAEAYASEHHEREAEIITDLITAIEQYLAV